MYDELIAILDDLDVALDNGFGKASTFIACTKAVRKIVELHKPAKIPTWVPTSDKLACKLCPGFYPCETIQIIAEELK